MPNTKSSLTSGSVKKHLFSLTWPMSVGIFAVLSTSLVDTYFVGKLGTQQLAALSFTFPLALAIKSISIGLGVGASSVISRVVGAGSMKEAKRITTDTLILSLLIIILISISGYLLVKPIFGLMGAEGIVLEYVNEYMTIWFLSLPLLVVPMVSGSIIRALGDSFWPSLQMVISAVINVLITPALIFGQGIFPKLGIEGAALGTTVAWFSTLFFSAWLIIFREKLITLNRVALREVFSSWKRVLAVGLPSATSQVIHPISIAVVTSFLATFGDDAVAAFGVGTRIESIILIPLFALSAGIPPLAGQNWGAGKQGRIVETLEFSYKLCLFWGLMTFTAIYFLADTLTPLFSENKTVQQVSSSYLMIVIITIIGYGVLMSSSAVFNATGKPLISLSFSFIRSIVLYLPLSYIAMQFGEVEYIFYAIAASNITSGLIAIIFSKIYLNKRIS